MKGQISSCSYYAYSYKGAIKSVVNISVKCEDLSTQTFEAEITDYSNYGKELLITAGFDKEPTEENLKLLNGPAQNVLNTKAMFHVRFYNGKPSRLILLH
ncbi:hypothetical protein [Halobacteriovorax sp. JY17]|uniref:hypothetical protein n=1 Tax=Halobacteriovorax sp. JY17 TaxID=2014617 RepID=UPI000C3B4A3E|nr:hypothetical protein [Halobacteriovorax sp. JY17]PIK15091.1 MAG: hypothetical protein CES88_12215 [Halobacteriovorax sp. JY17]